MARIAIDIGHGSDTFPPSKGVRRNGKNYPEHSFNSKLAPRLKALLEQAGHTVVYGPQKPNSPDVSLTRRTNWYNSNDIDLVVSVHANANNSASVNGRCVFYWSTSSKGKSLAERITREIRAKGYTLHGNGLHAGKRGSWTNLHITRETRMPAVLVEYGFMTGNKDFNLIFGSGQSKYIEDMAQATAKAVVEYFGGTYKASSSSSSTVTKTLPKSADDTIYRVQTGAFSNKENAERALKQAKDKLGDAILVEGTRTPKFDQLEVDGVWGRATTTRLQQVLNAPYVDGIISRQPDNQIVRRIRGAYVGAGSSPLVKLMQKELKVTEDGRIGPNTIRALQRRYGTNVTGAISERNSTVIKAMQEHLNKNMF